MTEQELVKQAQNGDLRAFEQLVNENKPHVEKVVCAMIRDTEMCEDIGQEVFIRFYKALRKFRGESSVRTYVTRIAINLCSSEIKKEKRRRTAATFAVTEVEIATDENLADAVITDAAVKTALQSLHEKMRTVVVLRYVEHYSVEETAALLRIPAGTVLSRASTGLAQLKKILDPLYGGVL